MRRLLQKNWGSGAEAPQGERVVCVLGVLAALAILPYLRALQLPFISDDYLQIQLGSRYGPFTGWRELIADPLYRCRSTSLVMTYWTWRLFDLNPVAYNWSSILLHVLNTWLVFALGAWRFIGWRVAAVAAGFFAIYEGHQEAVMWYAAVPELLVFSFCIVTLIAWISFLGTGLSRRRYYAAAAAAFLLALASKESAVAIVPVLFATLLLERAHWRKAAFYLFPFVIAAGLYFAAVHVSRSDHLFYHDGTFTLSAAFWKTLGVSTGRLFWFWGLASLIAILVFKPAKWLRTLAMAAVWIAITFLPYSFVSYMPRVPSRHTYLASVGLAVVVATSLIALRERIPASRQWVVGVLLAIMLVHNCGYIWTRKQRQYLERAWPTERLLAMARKTDGPIYLHCFPYPSEIARVALQVTGAKSPEFLIDGPAPAPGATTLCFGEHRGAEHTQAASGVAGGQP